jgi:hypothetical protein
VAQVTIRAPFVRVQVGGPGVHVRAPFVNLFVPSTPDVHVTPRVHLMPPADPAPTFEAPAPEPVPERLKRAPQVQPKPADVPPEDAPPAPAQPEQVLTLEQFAKAFQPKAGNYEVTLLNPVTRGATTVRFTLPEGTPRRVNLSRNEIEFDYGARRYVRIRFDRDGAEVSSR